MGKCFKDWRWSPCPCVAAAVHATDAFCVFFLGRHWTVKSSQTNLRYIGIMGTQVASLVWSTVHTPRPRRQTRLRHSGKYNFCLRKSSFPKPVTCFMRSVCFTWAFSVLLYCMFLLRLLLLFPLTVTIKNTSNNYALYWFEHCNDEHMNAWVLIARKKKSCYLKLSCIRIKKETTKKIHKIDVYKLCIYDKQRLIKYLVTYDTPEIRRYSVFISHFTPPLHYHRNACQANMFCQRELSNNLLLTFLPS